MWTVDLELIEPWLDSLDNGSLTQVAAAIRILEEQGPHLGRPLVDTVTASRHRNLKELRPGSSGRSELRVLFAFDPQRQAILLVEEHPSGRRPTGRPSTQTERTVSTVTKTLDDYLAKRPVDAEALEIHKQRMLTEVRAHRLRELREQAGLTQAQLAERIGVGQRQVSKIENGDLDSTRIGTIRSYLHAVGGELTIEYVLGDQRIQVA